MHSTGTMTAVSATLCLLLECPAAADPKAVQDKVAAAKEAGTTAPAVALWAEAYRVALADGNPAAQKCAVHARGVAIAVADGAACRKWSKVAGKPAGECPGSGGTGGGGHGTNGDDKWKRLDVDEGGAPVDGTRRHGLVYFVGGDFQMGSNGGDADEKPVHKVTLSGFWLGQSEVTEQDYRSWLKASKSKVGKPARSDTRYCNYGKSDRGRDPINCLQWSEAQQYCAERYVGGRLPTEAEWEFAARGKSPTPDAGRKYPWPTANAEPDKQLCWKRYQSASEGDGTCPVGSYPSGNTPAPHEIADLAGNVWEWVGDCYDKDYYAKSEERDPTGPRPEKCSARVVRGGSWFSRVPSGVRAAYRFGSIR